MTNILLPRASTIPLFREGGETKPSLQVLKDCWANVAAPVAVLTLSDAAGTVHGTTVTAFMSVSFDPPILMVSLAHASRFLKRLGNGTTFVLNVMKKDQAGIAAACAGQQADKFTRVALHAQFCGPSVTGANAWFGCVTNNIVTAGDHQLVFADIVEAHCGSAQAGLLYWQRQFVASCTSCEPATDVAVP